MIALVEFIVLWCKGICLFVTEHDPSDGQVFGVHQIWVILRMVESVVYEFRFDIVLRRLLAKKWALNMLSILHNFALGWQTTVS